MNRNIIRKLILLFFLTMTLVFLNIIKPKEENEVISNSTVKQYSNIDTQVNKNTVKITEEKKYSPIIKDFINYKYLTRNQLKALNTFKFNCLFFGIENQKSEIDYDNDGVDDYTDILNGAKAYVETKPIYLSQYYENGYPPKEEGVCTDVVWNALMSAGYVLKDLVDEDIKNNISLYPYVERKPDPNIDFRRVKNLEVYFSRNVEVLTLDTTKIEEWNPGDLITYSFSHIGVVSDMRNYKGVPYLIHHGGRTEAGEYNVLESDCISGHFRINFEGKNYE